MEFLNLDIIGTVQDHRIAMFRGVLIIRRLPTAMNKEKKLLMAAARMCPGVYIDSGMVLASVSINGYEALYNRYAALTNTLKDCVTQVRVHIETHDALGV